MPKHRLRQAEAAFEFCENVGEVFVGDAKSGQFGDRRPLDADISLVGVVLEGVDQIGDIGQACYGVANSGLEIGDFARDVVLEIAPGFTSVVFGSIGICNGLSLLVGVSKILERGPCGPSAARAFSLHNLKTV